MVGKSRKNLGRKMMDEAYIHTNRQTDEQMRTDIPETGQGCIQIHWS